MSYREPINGLDYKACKGCGDDQPISDFMRNDYETDYCQACRSECRVCGDYIGACQGEHVKEAA